MVQARRRLAAPVRGACFVVLLLVAICTPGSSNNHGQTSFVPPALPLAACPFSAAQALQPTISACAPMRQPLQQHCAWGRRSALSGLVAVAVEKRDLHEEPWRGATSSSAGATSPQGDAGSRGRTTAFLRQQGRKWVAEARAWTQEDERPDSPSGSALDGYDSDAQLPAASYVRQDLVDFLSENPLLSASGPVPKTCRPAAQEMERLGETRQKGAPASGESAGGHLGTELYREVFAKSPLTRRRAGPPRAISSQPRESAGKAVTQAGRDSDESKQQLGGQTVAAAFDKSSESLAAAVSAFVPSGTLLEDAAAGEEESKAEFVVGGDDDPLVQELLRDVFAEEIEEESRSTGWEAELLRDVFSQNPLTRQGSARALRRADSVFMRQEGGMENSDSWAAEMLDLFKQSPLTRQREE